jgi:uncharacterized membrane protein
MNWLLTYLAVAVPFVAIDMVWLSTMATRIYRPALGDLLLTSPRLLPAVVFYVLYPVGLVVFAVLPAWHDQSALRALTSGLLFGFFTYATYDLTNHATLRNWSTTLTVADTCWGSLLAAVSAWFGYLAAERLWPLA